MVRWHGSAVAESVWQKMVFAENVPTQNKCHLVQRRGMTTLFWAPWAWVQHVFMLSLLAPVAPNAYSLRIGITVCHSPQVVRSFRVGLEEPGEEVHNAARKQWIQEARDFILAARTGHVNTEVGAKVPARQGLAACL